MPLEQRPAASLDYPTCPASVPPDTIQEGRYEVGFAPDSAELDAVLKLRFEVFNLELGEGLEASFATGRDEDPFDAVCHHLVVRDLSAKEPTIVGSYRIQTHEMARSQLGFYAAGEFDLTAVPTEVISNSVEVGRACVALAHRSTQVLFLLWKGLAAYMTHNKKRYLFGCSSLTSQQPADGIAMFRYLEASGKLHPEIFAPAMPGFECEHSGPEPGPAKKSDLPPLFRIYLRHGAKVAGPPVIDREFGTIDFLTLFDVETMPRRMHQLFFGR